MITRDELLLIPKGNKVCIEWDKSKIVEVLYRFKGKGVFSFSVINVLTKRFYFLPNHMTEYKFQLLLSQAIVKLGQLEPLNYSNGKVTSTAFLEFVSRAKTFF